MRLAALPGLGALAITWGLCSCDDNDDRVALNGGSGGQGGGGQGGTLGGAGASGAGRGGGGAGAGGVAGAGGAAGGPCRLGSEWKVVDDYVYSEGLPTNVVGVAADSAGNVYAAGLGRVLNKTVGLLRKSVDSGATWADLPWQGELPNDIASDDAGNVFVTAGTSRAAVLKSADQGQSFVSVADIPSSPDSIYDRCNGGFVATGSVGVVVAGASCDGSGWVLMKSIDAGENWEKLFAFQLSPGKTARMHGVGVDAAGRAYAIGYALDRAESVHWVTVREGEGGQGVVSDDFQLQPGLVAQARGFGSPRAPIVVGFGTDGMGVYGIVRRQISLDSWATIDRFETRATDVEVVGTQLLIVGELESYGRVSVRSRRSDDLGTTWNPLLDYSYYSGQSSFAGQLASDPRGNVYSAAVGRDQDTVPHWIVRKLACQ